MPIEWPEPKGEFEFRGEVAVSEGSPRFAYEPKTLLVSNDIDLDLLGSVIGPDFEARPVADAFPLDRHMIVRGPFDALAAVALLRSLGLAAQPNHLFGAHACECCCGPHPADVMADPVRANPVRANPVRANPVRANPVRANPVRANAVPRSSARPAEAPPIFGAPVPATLVRVTVLDTGVAHGAEEPAFLAGTAVAGGGPAVSGEPDDADANGDQWLDPVAGHGSFIAGILQLRAPGCKVLVRKVVAPDGIASEALIGPAILAEAYRPEGQRPHLLNLSFGGAVWGDPTALASAVAFAQLQGIVVVASAGNDGWCEPMYPAALPGVVSVGAVGPEGPAFFTNYGSWVRACAPGVDIVSSFFTNFDGQGAPANGEDPDKFEGWACWSGTSFSTPAVVAALAREMQRTGSTPQEAVARIIDAPWLGRIPGLGTVVNI